MKRIVCFALVIIVGLLSSAQGGDWEGKKAISLRGGVLAPLSKGRDFTKFGRKIEPFMMGLNGALDFKYGLGQNFALAFGAGYSMTYDDSTAAKNQSFAFANSDKAYSKLTGIHFSLTGNYYVPTEKSYRPYFLGGFGVDFWEVDPRDSITPHYGTQDLGLKLGAGLEYWMAENVSLGLEARYTWLFHTAFTEIPDGYYGPKDWYTSASRPFNSYLEPSITLSYFFGGKDTDGDGVSDKKDNCPDTPWGAIVDKAGCPLDGDGDGIYDGLDQCPGTPQGATVDPKGCPIDSDKDGVFDGLDKCPETPEGVTVNPDGCPPDGDGDGVPDYRDKQLDTPKGAKVDADGVAIDSDKDGIIDLWDVCPGTPVGIEVDSTGCPKFIKRLTQKVTLNIKYAPNSFEPDSASKHVLDSIAEILVAYPDTKISVNGFTDDRSTEEKNLVLSQNRAEGVRAYLLGKGIEVGRMNAQGFGENPQYFVGDNATAEGRQMNRRVEIETVNKE